MDNANTLLYYDTTSGLYCSYRSWDGGTGSLTIKADTLPSVTEAMQKSRTNFTEPFIPKGGIPEIDWGNLDSRRLKPLDENLVREVAQAVRHGVYDTLIRYFKRLF